MFMVEEKSTGNLLKVYEVERKGDSSEFLIHNGNYWSWVSSSNFIPAK